MSYADDKVKQIQFQQSRGCNSKINDPIWPILEFIQDFIHVHLVCKFQEDLIKTEQVMLMTSISLCKFMEPCGCHSNQRFQWNSMKSLSLMHH